LLGASPAAPPLRPLRNPRTRRARTDRPAGRSRGTAGSDGARAAAARTTTGGRRTRERTCDNRRVTPAGERVRVLLIDDDAKMVRLVRSILRDDGFDVVG